MCAGQIYKLVNRDETPEEADVDAARFLDEYLAVLREMGIDVDDPNLPLFPRVRAQEVTVPTSISNSWVEVHTFIGLLCVGFRSGRTAAAAATVSAPTSP